MKTAREEARMRAREELIKALIYIILYVVVRAIIVTVMIKPDFKVHLTVLTPYVNAALLIVSAISSSEHCLTRPSTPSTLATKTWLRPLP